MIRTHSIIINADKNQIMIQIGWHDPGQSMLRSNMQTMMVEAVRDFQQRCRILGRPFTVEDLCKFCMERKKFGPHLALVNVLDGKGGLGAEWRKTDVSEDATKVEFDADEFRERIKTYTSEQLASVMSLAAKNDHSDIITMIQEENERRKV